MTLKSPAPPTSEAKTEEARKQAAEWMRVINYAFEETKKETFLLSARQRDGIEFVEDPEVLVELEQCFKNEERKSGRKGPLIAYSSDIMKVHRPPRRPKESMTTSTLEKTHPELCWRFSLARGVRGFF